MSDQPRPFTKEALREAAEQIGEAPSPPLDVQTFGPDNFADPAAEEYIAFLRGARDDYRDAVHFWLRALHYLNEHEPSRVSFGNDTLYNEEHRCQEIPLKTFVKLLMRGSELQAAHDFHLRGEFERGWVMFDEWDEVSVIAETAEEYVAFFWYTTS